MLLFRHDQNNSEKQWIPIDTVDISGPINIARFAQNAAPHHTLAVGARLVHILKIEAKSPWKVTPYKTIDQTKLREKCWVGSNLKDKELISTVKKWLKIVFNFVFIAPDVGLNRFSTV